MNAIIFDKKSRQIYAVILNVTYYDRNSIKGDSSSIDQPNYNNVSILITRHTVSTANGTPEPFTLPEEWLSDEYKIDLLE